MKCRSDMFSISQWTSCGSGNRSPNCSLTSNQPSSILKKVGGGRLFRPEAEDKDCLSREQSVYGMRKAEKALCPLPISAKMSVWSLNETRITEEKP